MSGPSDREGSAQPENHPFTDKETDEVDRIQRAIEAVRYTPERIEKINPKLRIDSLMRLALLAVTNVDRPDAADTVTLANRDDDEENQNLPLPHETFKSKYSDISSAVYSPRFKNVNEDTTQKVEALAEHYAAKREPSVRFIALTPKGRKAWPRTDGLIDYLAFDRRVHEDAEAVWEEFKVRAYLLEAYNIQIQEMHQGNRKMAINIANLSNWSNLLANECADLVKALQEKEEELRSKESRPQVDPDQGDVDLLMESIEKQAEQIQSLQSENTQLKSRLREASIATGVSNSSTSRAGAKSGKLTVPDFYNDEDKDNVPFEQWYTQMTDKLEVNADHFHDDRAKFAEIRSRLKGPASKALMPYTRAGHPDRITTSKALMEHLWEEYHDPNTEENAIIEFQDLRMKVNDNYQTFKNEFVRLAGECRINKDTWKHEFKRRLPVSLQNALVQSYINKSIGFQEYARQGAEISLNLNQAYAQRQNNKPSNDKSGGNKAGGKKNSGGNKDKEKEKDKGKSTKTDTSKLTDDEVQRRLQEGRCFHCNETGHRARNCPQKPDDKNKAAKVATIMAKLGRATSNYEQLKKSLGETSDESGDSESDEEKE